MTGGIVTEWEWRKQMHRAKPARPRCWGAQCMLLPAKKQTLKQDRAFHAFLLLLSMTVALLMPVFVPKREQPATYPQAYVAASAKGTQVREVSAVSYALSSDVSLTSATYTHEQLLRGKLMLLTENHPLPFGAPAPNTVSIAAYGKGMVPVNDLSLKSGQETINALAHMFASLRGRGVSGFSVWRATLSPAEQRALQLSQLSTFARQMPLNDAVRLTLAQTDKPYTGDLQQEYTVEIRMSAAEPAMADERPLGQTEQGRALLQSAWRHGFVQRFPEAEGARAYRFRYVGEAHATAMTYLDVTFESYLELLHERGMLVVKKDGVPRYVIVCKPISGTHVEFRLPENATYEASLDNTGYAVVACTLKDE